MEFVLAIIGLVVTFVFWRCMWRVFRQIDVLVAQGQAANLQRQAIVAALQDLAAAAPKRPVDADDNFDALVAADLAGPKKRP
jgi:hypothetical protein